MNKVNVLKSSFTQCAIALALTTMLSGASADPAVTPTTSAVHPIPALLIANAERSMLLGIARAGDNIVAVGGNGVIVRSADAKAWRQVKSPVDTALNAVAFADANHGWAVGHDSVILGTTDGGVTWKIQNFQPDLNAPIFSVIALSPDKAIAVGAFGLIKATEDGGASWKDVDAVGISGDKLHLNSITRLGNGELAVAGERGLVGVSADGQQWIRIATPYEGSFFGILPWGAKGMIAFGMRGNVYVCNDTAVPHWNKIETATISSFFGGEVLPGGAVRLTGSESTMIVIQLDGSVSVPRKIGQRATSDSSLTGSLKSTSAEIIISETGVSPL